MKPKNVNKHKIKEGAQARSSSSPGSIVLPKPCEQAGATKFKFQKRPFEKHKTRQLIRDHWHVLKELCHVFYHDMLLLGRVIVWFATTRRDELMQIVLLLIIMYLQYRIHTESLIHR